MLDTLAGMRQIAFIFYFGNKQLAKRFKEKLLVSSLT